MSRKGADERKTRDEAFEELMASVNADFALRRELKLARRRVGLSQRELAHRMRIAHSTLARLEEGKSLPTLKTLRRIAEATGSRLVIRLDAPNAVAG